MTLDQQPPAVHGQAGVTVGYEDLRFRMWASAPHTPPEVFVLIKPPRRQQRAWSLQLADAAMAGRRVEIQLRVRRFFCEDADYPVKTFVGQAAGLTERYGRRTGLLRRMLESIGTAPAGRAGALPDHQDPRDST
jgi:hypothetical protein